MDLDLARPTRARVELVLSADFIFPLKICKIFRGVATVFFDIVFRTVCQGYEQGTDSDEASPHSLQKRTWGRTSQHPRGHTAHHIATIPITLAPLHTRPPFFRGFDLSPPRFWRLWRSSDTAECLPEPPPRWVCLRRRRISVRFQSGTMRTRWVSCQSFFVWVTITFVIRQCGFFLNWEAEVLGAVFNF